MAESKSSASTLYEIIVNDEHQFTVWPSKGSIPKGWRYIGKSGTKAELEAHLKEMYVETRPAPFLVSGRRSPGIGASGKL